MYCCHACNEFKSNYWNPDSVERVLNPLVDKLGTHIEERDGLLQGLTQTGAFFIERLQLSRPRLIAHRLERARRELIAERQMKIEKNISAMEALLAEIYESLIENEETE